MDAKKPNIMLKFGHEYTQNDTKKPKWNHDHTKPNQENRLESVLFKEECCSGMKSKQNEQKVFPNPLSITNCCVCDQPQYRNQLKCLSTDDSKLVVASILYNEMTPVKANFLLEQNGIAFICQNHLEEVTTEIPKILQSQSYIAKLMIIVTSYYPDFIRIEYRNILSAFQSETNRNRKITVLKRCHSYQLVSQQAATDPYTNPQELICFVCSLKKNKKYFCEVVDDYTKLVILVGCIIGGKIDLDDARQAFLSKREVIMICHDEYLQSIKEIYEYLCIKNANGLEQCSMNLMKELMITVNLLCPEFRLNQFREILSNLGINYEQSMRKVKTINVNNTSKLTQKFVNTDVENEWKRVQNNESKEEKESLTMILDKVDQIHGSPCNKTAKGHTIEKTEKESIVSTESEDKSSTKQCDICSEVQYQKYMKVLSSEKLKLVFACVIRKDFPFNRANKFLEKAKTFICHSHFFKVMHGIRDSLVHQDYFEQLIVILHTFYPQFSSLEFQNILNEFYWTNEKYVKNQSIFESFPRPTSKTLSKNHVCSVCFKRKNAENLCFLDTKTMKMVFLVGCIISGKFIVHQNEMSSLSVTKSSQTA